MWMVAGRGKNRAASVACPRDQVFVMSEPG